MVQQQPTRIHVFLVDKQALMRAGLRLLLDQEATFRVVGEASTGHEAFAGVAQTQPDVILLELDSDRDDALAVVSDLLTAAERARIILVTGRHDPVLHQRAVQLGAMGVVLKIQAAGELFQAIHKVYAGEVWLDRQLMARLLRPTAMVPQPVQGVLLNDREYAIVALICKGLHNRQIGTHLHLAEVTVRHHLTDIYRRCGVTSRLELVVFAYSHRLCHPE